MGLKKLLFYFFTWRISIQLALVLSIAVLPLRNNFLGGGLYNYLNEPYLWSWANFDGEHYLFIAESGYRALTYFFFPVYPTITREIGQIFGLDPARFISPALLVSNISFLIGLLGLCKLISLDYSREVVRICVILILVFPTSFFFGAVYTEGLFFALTVWAFYFARKERWLATGVLGAFATATRITGIALLPAILWEYFVGLKKDNSRKIKGLSELNNVAAIMIMPTGILAYMTYLYYKTGDFLAFFHNLNTVYGDQRSNHFVLLPQVFYRYFFKILPNIDYSYWPVVLTTWLEIVTALVFGGLIFLGVVGGLKKSENYKMRESYIVYSVFTYLIPTFSGSFSSFPRYVLIIFPAFIVGALYIYHNSKIFRRSTFTVSVVLLVIFLTMFSRGYWVS